MCSKPQNHRKPWSPRDIALLTTLYNGGDDILYIANALGRTYWATHTMLRDLEIRGKRRPPAVRWQFKKMTRDLAYILGCYLSDGWFSRRVGLGAKDEDFVLAFADALHNLTGRQPNIYYKDLIVAMINCPDLGYWLERETAVKKKIPERLFFAEREFRLEMAAGAMDGDGWISYREQHDNPRALRSQFQMGFATNRGWADDFARLLSSLGIICMGPYQKKSKNYPLVQYNLNKESVARSDFYFRMERKQERLLHMRRLYLSSETICSDPQGDKR